MPQASDPGQPGAARRGGPRRGWHRRRQRRRAVPYGGDGRVRVALLRGGHQGGEVAVRCDEPLALATHAATLTLRRETRPELFAKRSDSAYCASAVGTLASRAARTRHRSSVSVGMRSKVSRTVCSGEARTLSDSASSPAVVHRPARPRRSFIAAMVTTSTASAGTALQGGHGGAAVFRDRSEAGGGEVVDVRHASGDAKIGGGQGLSRTVPAKRSSAMASTAVGVRDPGVSVNRARYLQACSAGQGRSSPRAKPVTVRMPHPPTRRRPGRAGPPPPPSAFTTAACGGEHRHEGGDLDRGGRPAATRIDGVGALSCSLIGSASSRGGAVGSVVVASSRRGRRSRWSGWMPAGRQACSECSARKALWVTFIRVFEGR